MSVTTQQYLLKVRPPRVKIVYEVETGGALEKRELPFIIGIFADLSGDSATNLPPVKDRQFVEIDRDNFDTVLQAAQPTIMLSSIDDLLEPQPATTTAAAAPSTTAAAPSTTAAAPSTTAAAPSTTAPVQTKPEEQPNPQGQANPEGQTPPPQGDAPSPQVQTPPPPRQTPPAPKLTGVLTFKSLDDFNPLPIVKNIPKMADLYEARSRIRDLNNKAETSDNLGGVLDASVSDSPDGKAIRDQLKSQFDPTAPDSWATVNPRPVTLNGQQVDLLTSDYLLTDPDKRADALQMLGQFTKDILANLTAGTDEGAGNLMSRRIAQIDELLTRQVNAVMHGARFQKLEATWRGLFYLVSRTPTIVSSGIVMLRLRVMNIARDELLKDLQKAVEVDQSTIFKLIYEAEYGTYGGYPYSLLLGDYEFGRKSPDIELLKQIAHVASASHAPFIAAADTWLFDLDSFEKLARPRDLTQIFQSGELIEWQDFRSQEESRYVTLTLPKVLLRLPYGPETVPVDGIDFAEETSGAGDIDATKFLWGNPAYVLAERIVNAFFLYGWTAAIRGVEGGGLVEGLPSYTFKTSQGDVSMVCPTQVAITDRREKELNDLGFMAICHCKGSNKAAFFGGQTTNLPKKYITDAANSNAQISAMLPYILAASRFAHYIKVIMREKVGSFLTRGNVESLLNTWIAQYVLLDDNATQQVKAAYPLRQAQVTVTDVPGQPGAYRATVFLKPHFQLEELTTSIRLVADIPA